MVTLLHWFIIKEHKHSFLLKYDNFINRMYYNTTYSTQKLKEENICY